MFIWSKLGKNLLRMEGSQDTCRDKQSNLGPVCWLLRLILSRVSCIFVLHAKFCEVNNLSVKLITYFTVIQTDAYIFHISTLPTSICIKTTVKKR